MGILALRVGVWVVQQQEGRDATVHLAAAIAATPDGGTVDLGKAFPASWDQAAVVGDYATGGDVNGLLGVHALDDGAPLTAEDTDLVFVDADRVVAIIALARQGFDFGDARDPAWRPLKITRDRARFTVRRSGGSSGWALLLPAGS